MKILFTICARKGSKGLKNKNISNFLEYPICYYTLSAYKLFVEKNKDYECELALNTDSMELVEQFKQTGIEFKHIPRTEDLAGDRVGKIDVIKDTFLKMGKAYDVVIDLDLTSPLRCVEDIEGVLNSLINTSDAEVAFSATNSRRSPYFNQVKRNEDGFYTPVLYKGVVSRQEAPDVFDMNASIYAYSPKFLSKAMMLFDAKAVAYMMKDTAVLDIDNPEDRELMEILAKYFYAKYPDYNLIYETCSQI